MPQDERFDRLVEEAATGLKADHELYLDIRQELRSHLDDKAEAFVKKGHPAADSEDLAVQWFGSPLDMAHELQRANLSRMRWRARMRVFLTWVAMPLAILAALYLGYGRIASMSTLAGISTGQYIQLPLLSFSPFMPFQKAPATIPSRDPQAIYAYWDAHRDAPDNARYYAYYTLNATHFTDEKVDLLNIYREGERLQPDNALYPIFTAAYLLDNGALARGDDGTFIPKVNNRAQFEAAVQALLRAAQKDRLCTYRTSIIRERLNAYPSPRFIEEYIAQIGIAAAEIFPEYGRMREVYKKLPLCARVLIAEGRRDEAEALLDTWKPLATQMASAQDLSMIGALVADNCGMTLATGAAEVYDELNLTQKARETHACAARVKQVKKKPAGDNTTWSTSIRLHGSFLANIIFPVFYDQTTTASMLTASRMAEHIIFEEVMLMVVSALLVLAMVNALLQGMLWRLRARKSNAAPLLLVPPAKELVKIVLLGIALPLLVYFVYSRLPVIGGRQFGWPHMWPRFTAELLLLAGVLLYLPLTMISRYVRRRCDDLNIDVPKDGNDHYAAFHVFLCALIVTAIFAVALPLLLRLISPDDSMYMLPMLITLCTIFVATLLAGNWLIQRRNVRNGHSIYHGTMARSVAPFFALAILFLTLIVQPIMLHQEQKWLRADPLLFGYIADKNNPHMNGCTLPEEKATLRLQHDLLQALETKNP